MDNILKDLLSKAQAKKQKEYENALIDLRLIIERCTQNRYSDEGIANYLLLFYDRSLINYKLNNESLIFIKYFLFYALLNFPDRSVLVAKCIKVLYDISIREAICSAIEINLRKDDNTTCELIFAITDLGDAESYLSDKRILNLFIDISKFGGENSKEVANAELNYYKEHFNI